MKYAVYHLPDDIIYHMENLLTGRHDMVFKEIFNIS